MATLGIWYVFAALAPIVVGAWLLGTEFLDLGAKPQAPFKPCTGPMRCGGWFPNWWDVLRHTAAFLVVSLVIALPLRAFLVRRFESPVAAGTLAAVNAWTVCALGVCCLSWLLAR
ncbi:hypothetical protein Rhe02_69480 [Rhizocola hellebori]|uniref:Uncharacterized protein n=1 Tax=Rhizocola hellebori TaxID=1392758 RepID=A0A8J3QDU2_9ACTN|nr:hypothetical protein Rhe02_69480 [Rhizocola hellebori]